MKVQRFEEKKAQVQENFKKVHEEVQAAIEDYITQGYLQTLATLLVYLDENKVESVMEQLPVPVWKEVRERYEKLSFKNRENEIAIFDVQHILKKAGFTEKELCNSVTQGLDYDAIHELENSMSDFSKIDPIITKSIEDYLFEFDDFLKLDDRAVQKVLRDVEQQTLALALKGADPKVQDKIFRNMSKKAVELLKEDMEFMGPVRLKHIDAARKEIVQIVYRLESNGDIVIVRNPEDFLIS